MAGPEDFPVSPQAMSRARRSLERIDEIDDPVERISELLLMANSVNDIVASQDVVLSDLQYPSFRNGIRFALRTLLENGMDESVLPVDALKERALLVDVGSATIMEGLAEARGVDIADLYLEEDGGNG